MLRGQCETMVGVAGALLVVLMVGAAHGLGGTQVYPPSSKHGGPAWFEDFAGKAGIRVLNANGGVESKHYIVEATGSGVALFDYDSDGWPDIFLVNGELLPGKKPQGEHPT